MAAKTDGTAILRKPVAFVRDVGVAAKDARRSLGEAAL